MKKKYFTVAVILTAISSIMFTSCIGSFKLTNKVLAWNQQIGNKFVNELVFFAFWILPVYEISAIADVLILNSIEFWSGSNPITAETKIIDGKDAQYKVERDMAGYTITNLSDKSVVKFNFDEMDNSWSVSANGKTTKFMEFVDDSHVKMITPNGDFKEIELSQNGVYAYQQIATSAQFAMAK